MALSTHRWTRADLERLPDDGNRYEVVRGELFVTPVPRPAHAFIVRELRDRLDSYCRAGGPLVALELAAFVDDESEVIPDIVIGEKVMPPPERWDEMPTPALVVEVLSRSTRSRDLVKKRVFYMESGIPEYWIVDGGERTIRVVRPEGETLEAERLHWMPAGAANAFELDVRQFFEGAIGPAGRAAPPESRILG